MKKDIPLTFDTPILANSLKNSSKRKQQSVSIDDLFMYPQDNVQIVIPAEFGCDEVYKKETMTSEPVLFAKKIFLKKTVSRNEIEDASRFLYSVREPNCATTIYSYNEIDKRRSQEAGEGKVFAGNGYAIDYVWKKEAEEIAKQSFTRIEPHLISDSVNKILTYFPALVIKVEDLLLHIHSPIFDKDSGFYNRRMGNIELFAMFGRSFNKDELDQIGIGAARDWCYGIYLQIVDKDAERVE